MKTISVSDFAELIDVSTHLIYKILKEHNLKVIPQGNRKALPPETARKILTLRGFQFKSNNKPRIINVYGMKGGIGKTSLATALSEGASRLGFKVLAIDLDMQGNLTQSFNMKKHGQDVLLDVVKEEKDIENVIQEVDSHLDLLPSSLDNSQLETILGSQTVNVVSYFKSLLEPLYNKYDLIILDCPPSITKSTICATCLADINLIPLNPDMDSFDGVVMSVAEIKKLEKAFKDFDVKINYKILFNKYDARERLSLTIMGLIAENIELKDNLLPTVIRTNTAFKNTKADGEYIFDLKRSTAKEDCLALITELTNISHWVENKSKLKNGDKLELA